MPKIAIIILLRKVPFLLPIFQNGSSILSKKDMFDFTAVMFRSMMQTLDHLETMHSTNISVHGCGCNIQPEFYLYDPCIFTPAVILLGQYLFSTYS